MDHVEQIEYYLGKDRLPNVHWKPKIPTAFEIPSRKNDLLLCNKDSAHTTITVGGIDYYHNNLGYRSSFDYDLNLDNIVLLLGDSDTFGTGAEYNEIYSTKLQQLSDYCIVNLGVPGLSGDGMARIGCQTILALKDKIKHVCVLWPVASLREFVSKTYQAGIHSMSKELPYDNWWDHIDWISNNYNYQKNKLLLKSLTESIGIEYHDLVINRYDKNSVVSYINAGPFTEFDADSHTAIANYFYKKITHQPSLFEQRSRSLK
jgi:hypothetical protein